MKPFIGFFKCCAEFSKKKKLISDDKCKLLEQAYEFIISTDLEKALNSKKLQNSIVGLKDPMNALKKFLSKLKTYNKIKKMIADKDLKAAWDEIKAAFTTKEGAKKLLDMLLADIETLLENHIEVVKNIKTIVSLCSSIIEQFNEAKASFAGRQEEAYA